MSSGKDRKKRKQKQRKIRKHSMGGKVRKRKGGRQSGKGRKPRKRKQRGGGSLRNIFDRIVG